MSCGSGGSKSRLAKAAGAEPSGEVRDEKLHAVVGRSTFASEKAKDTSRSEHFWKLRCRKSARRCGAKHISESKVLKTDGFGALLEVEMSKKCTPLLKAPHVRPTLGRWSVVLCGRRKGILHPAESEQSVEVTNTQLQLQLQLHYITQHYSTLITLHCATTTTATATTTTTTLHYTTLCYSYNDITWHYTTLDYATLYHATVQNITAHYTTLRYTSYTTPQLHLQLRLHYTNYITFHCHYNSTTLHHSYNYNCATPRYIQQLWWGDRCNHCNHSKKHNSNHLSVHQWIRSAIRDSQQPTSPIGFLFPIHETSAAALCCTDCTAGKYIDTWTNK